MAGESRIDILLAVRNQASAALREADTELKQLGVSSSDATSKIERMVTSFLTIEGAIQVGRATIELMQMGAQAERLRTSFDTLAKQASTSGAAMLSAMRQASAGTISDMQLETDANKARVLGVATSTKQLTDLLTIARVQGAEFGKSTAEAYDIVTEGIGRMSTRMLTSIGITIDQKTALEQYAASINKTADSLSEAEQRQAIYAAVVQSTKSQVEAQSGSVNDAAGSFERFGASLTNAKEALGSFLLLGGLVPKFLDDVSKELQGDAALFQLSALGARYFAENMGLIAPAADSAAVASNAGGNAMQWLSSAAGGVSSAMPQVYASLLATVPAFGIVQDMATSTSNKLAALQDQINGLKNAAVGRLAGAAAGVADFTDETTRVQHYNEAVQDTKNKIDAIETARSKNLITYDEEQRRIAEVNQASTKWFDDVREGHQQAISDSKKWANTIQSDVSKAYDDLKGKVSGVISGAMSNDTGVNPDTILGRPDAINEDARRLADIAVKGFDSPWFAYFKDKFPALFQDVFAGAAGADGVKKQAAQLLKNFQDGIEPELLDKEKAKELVRRMILGEQATNELVKEITDELNAEFGKSAPSDLKSLAKQALTGGADGTGAGAAFQGADVLSGASTGGANAAAAFAGAVVGSMTGTGNKAIAAIETELRADGNLAKMAQAGALGGTRYGSEFLTNAINSISKPFIDAVSAIVTGNVIAYQQQQTQLTGATP